MSVLKIKNANNEWESVPVINGEDGVSPTITTSKVGKETTLTITDVNGTHTATILDGVDGTGSGDMTKSVYDTNNNGIVDNAEKVNNHTVQSDVPANAVFTDTTYTAGTGIAINNGVISNTQTSAEWGNITGTLSSQTDLQTALNNKADANDMPTKVSDLTNDSGFITSSSLPTKTSDLTNDSGFITRTVNNLWNYYTSTQVDNLLSNKASKSIYSDTAINVGRKWNTTKGSYSTAEGMDTTASESASHAEGWGTTASGKGSHAEGEYTVANSKAQHVFGRYNILDTNDDNKDYGDYVEIVGNGSYNARSNARTLDWSGNETLAGDSTVGGTVKATKGIWSRPTGEVGTATSDSNGCLLIKRASSSEAPNNGVVLEYGDSANYRGQLYIGDNATQGIYYNGWSDGVRGTWQKLVDTNSLNIQRLNANSNTFTIRIPHNGDSNINSAIVLCNTCCYVVAIGSANQLWTYLLGNRDGVTMTASSVTTHTDSYVDVKLTFNVTVWGGISVIGLGVGSYV